MENEINKINLFRLLNKTENLINKNENKKIKEYIIILK